MILTNEVLEMWEWDAQRGCRDSTRANARVVQLVAEVRELTEQLGEMTERLCLADADFAASIRVALTAAGHDALGEAA